MFKRIALTALFLLLLLGTAGLYVLHSNTGLRWLLTRLEHMDRIALHFTGVNGQLTGPITVQQIVVDHARAHIVANNVLIDWTPSSILHGSIKIRTLHSDHVTVTVKRAAQQSNTPPRFLPWWLRISVDEVHIAAPSFIYADQQPLQAERVSCAVTLTRRRLTLNNLQVIAKDYQAQADATLRAGKTITLALYGNGQYRDPSGTLLQGQVKLQGEPTTLDIDATLQAPTAAKIHTQLTFPEQSWQLSGQATAPTVAFTPWTTTIPFSLQAVAVNFKMNKHGLNIAGTTKIPELAALPVYLTAQSHYAHRTLTVQQAELRFPTRALEAAHIKATARIQLQTPAPAITAQIQWHNLTWPLQPAHTTHALRSATGHLHLSGQLPYQFTLQDTQLTTAVDTTMFTAKLNARGQFTKQHLHISHYQLDALAGTTTGTAQLQLPAPHAWNLTLASEQVNPGLIVHTLPGTVNLQAKVWGQDLNARNGFTLQLEQLTGRLRELPLRARGTLTRAGQNWRADQVHIKWGATDLTAQGQIDDTQVDVVASLHSSAAQQLKFNPTFKLSGPLEFELRAQGARALPNLTAHLHAQQLQWDNYIASALQITGQGTTAQHHITLNTGIKRTQDKQPLGYLALTSDGRYTDGSWESTLTQLIGSDAHQHPRVQLQSPATLHISQAAIKANELCFSIDTGRWCTQGIWHADATWHVASTLTALPLSLLNDAFIQGSRYDGQLLAALDLTGGHNLTPKGTLTAQLQQAAIHYTSSHTHTETISLDTAKLDLHADGSVLRGTAILRTDHDTQANLQLQLQELTQQSPLLWPLQATLHAHSTQAALLPLFFADLDRVSGALDTHLHIQGSLTQPLLQGNLQIQQAALELYQLNLKLKDFGLNAQFDATQLHFAAQGSMGEGNVNVTGEYRWTGDQPSGHLTLQGKNLLVADVPEYRVVTSPKLDFHLIGSNAKVSGEILIPSAQLQPKSVSGAVQPSSDARFSDEQPSPHNRWNISSEVRIRLGEAVRIDALGLQGQLRGAVTTTLNNDNPATGQGELSVQDGHYEAYGRKLDIMRGRLIFDASPLSDPGLDIQAERNINDITVGVNVRGVLHAPRLQFYSTPAMSQTQIVSYLLVGKPLDELQSTEASTVRSASSSLALQGGGLLAAKLGRRVGLEEVGIETSANNQAALVLGKFLSPRLFVSYGISLSEAINTLKLRYTLGDHWVMKTESGDAHSADIEFKIER